MITMSERKKPGRPPRVDAASHQFVQGRCTSAEKQLWTDAASARHVSLGEAMREALTDWTKTVLALSDEEAEARMHPAPPAATAPAVTDAEHIPATNPS